MPLHHQIRPIWPRDRTLICPAHSERTIEPRWHPSLPLLATIPAPTQPFQPTTPSPSPLRAGPEWKIYGKFVQPSSLSQPGWVGFRVSVFREKIRGCLLHEALVAKRAELTVGRKFEFVVQILIPTYLLSEKRFRFEILGKPHIFECYDLLCT
jgi:hypothetical protein